jgi:hypothetical protein
MVSSLFTAVALYAALGGGVPLELTHTNGTKQCKVIPGDAAWPNSQAWDRLNRTVGGKLIATVPIGHVCHAPTFDEAACSKLQSDWGLASLV